MPATGFVEQPDKILLPLIPQMAGFAAAHYKSDS
jgi:hypothetical protein